jgi:dihydrofolate reductase
MLSLVIAVADNGVIGIQNRLPWRAPADLARFKQLTMGKPMIMGRKTFDSLGRVLPGRPHIVITRQQDLQLPENCHVVHSIDEAIAKAATLVDGSGDIVVIGGADIYGQALPLADCVHLTRVHLTPEGDTFFADLDSRVWRIAETAEAEGEPACTYITYQRI